MHAVQLVQKRDTFQWQQATKIYQLWQRCMHGWLTFCQWWPSSEFAAVTQSNINFNVKYTSTIHKRQGETYIKAGLGSLHTIKRQGTHHYRLRLYSSILTVTLILISNFTIASPSFNTWNMLAEVWGAPKCEVHVCLPLTAQDGASCGGEEEDGSPIILCFLATSPVKSVEPFAKEFLWTYSNLRTHEFMRACMLTHGGLLSDRHCSLCWIILPVSSKSSDSSVIYCCDKWSQFVLFVHLLSPHGIFFEMSAECSVD